MEAVQNEEDIEEHVPVEGEEPITDPEETWLPDPAGALWRSGVIAGWGQFYNKQYIKGIVLCGLEALTIYGIIYYADAARYERREFESYGIPERGISPDLAEKIAERDYHLDLYNNYRVNYESHIWLTALVVVYSMLDAYVDAHLADFETGEELGETPSSATGVATPGENHPSFSIDSFVFPDSAGGWGVGLNLSLSF